MNRQERRTEGKGAPGVDELIRLSKLVAPLPGRCPTPAPVPLDRSSSVMDHTSAASVCLSNTGVAAKQGLAFVLVKPQRRKVCGAVPAPWALQPCGYDSCHAHKTVLAVWGAAMRPAKAGLVGNHASDAAVPRPAIAPTCRDGSGLIQGPYSPASMRGRLKHESSAAEKL